MIIEHLPQNEPVNRSVSVNERGLRVSLAQQLALALVTCKCYRVSCCVYMSVSGEDGDGNRADVSK